MGAAEEITRQDIRLIVGDLPDSRPMVQRGQILTPFGLATPCFCASCGKQEGYVYCSTEFILYLCDDCEKEGGRLPLPVVDPDYARGRKEH